jgi:hypothetical protein
MDSSEVLRIVGSIVTAVGGMGVVIGAVLGWLGKIWADKMYLKTSAGYERELERLRNQYSAELERFRAISSERRDVLGATLDALASTQTLWHDRLVASLELIWSKMLETREFVSRLVFLYDILPPTSYPTMDSAQLANFFPRMTLLELGSRVEELRKDVDQHRPFVGERLWLLYNVYSVFALQLGAKLVQSEFQKGLPEWDKKPGGEPDSFPYHNLALVLSEDELRGIIGADPRGVPGRILAALEGKVLSEMNRLVFGRQLIDISVEEQLRVAKLWQPIDSSLEPPLR